MKPGWIDTIVGMAWYDRWASHEASTGRSPFLPAERPLWSTTLQYQLLVETRPLPRNT